MQEPTDRAIVRLAQRQRGYVTRRKLLDAGLGAEGIKYRIKVRRLIPVYAGVYAVGHVPTLVEDRAVGALLACGRGGVLSHGSAAALWGVGKWRMPFEVTAPSAHRRTGIRVHRARTLTRRDVRVHGGIRVTSAARTLLDVAPRLSEKALRRAVNELRLALHLRMPELADVLLRCPRHPGARRLRHFVEAPSGPTRSEFEDAFGAFTERFGLPRPLMNTRIAGREVDAFFPVERVIARGLVTVRITWDRLNDTPAREAARLEAILKARKGEGAKQG